MFYLRNIKFKEILHIKELSIPSNKVTCIVGESGSGKTTLIKLLNNLISSTEGEILFKGKSILDLNPLNLRRQVVMLPQTPAIFNGNVRDNLLAGLRFSEKPLADDRKLNEILQMVKLKAELYKDADKLSGGEKQRLALGRVILMDPEVFLLDEPSSALDEETEIAIINKLVQYVKEKNKTLIMVTHSKNLSNKFSENTIEIKNGKLIE